MHTSKTIDFIWNCTKEKNSRFFKRNKNWKGLNVIEHYTNNASQFSPIIYESTACISQIELYLNFVFIQILAHILKFDFVSFTFHLCPPRFDASCERIANNFLCQMR